jgi:hypothetical protein
MPPSGDSMKLPVPYILAAIALPLTLGATARQQAQQSQGSPATQEAQPQQAPETQQAAPQAPPQQQAAPAVVDPNAIRYSFGGNVAQIPATFLNNVIFIPMQVNGGTPGFFLLDSTAEKTTIEPSAAPGATGNSLSYAVLKMPGVQVPMATLQVVAHPKFAEQYGVNVRGVLGRDFLTRTVIQINYPRQTLQIYDPAAFTYSGQGTSFPVTETPAGPAVRARFQLHKNLEAQFVFDTALDYSYLFSRAFTDSQKISASHFHGQERSDPQIDDGAKIFLGRVRALELKPYTVENAIGVFSQQNLNGVKDSKIAGAIGGGFLRRFNVIFDLPHNRVILDPNLQINTLEDADMSGLSLVAKGGNLRTFEVVGVQKGTPAHDAGIQVGDVISGVDDEPAADYTLTELRDTFQKFGNESGGHAYKLLVDRNGQTLTLKMKMRRMI